MNNFVTGGHAMSKVNEEYLDYKQLCDFLNISYGTARNWKSRGKLTYTVLNDKVYFPKKAIMKELKLNTIKSVATMIEELEEKGRCS
jgi:hypothetical protein